MGTVMREAKDRLQVGVQLSTTRAQMQFLLTTYYCMEMKNMEREYAVHRQHHPGCREVQHMLDMLDKAYCPVGHADQCEHNHDSTVETQGKTTGTAVNQPATTLQSQVREE